MYHNNPLANLLIWVFTGFGYFGERFKASRNILTNTQLQIVDAVAEKERLKTQLDQLKVELQTQKQYQGLEINRERAAWEIERQHSDAKYKMQIDAEKSKFNLEREQAELKEKFAVESAVKRAELKADETITLKKLESEQKVKQAELDAEKKILAVKEEYAKKESQLHAKLHEDMYKKLNDALVQMSQEGDKNTKFVHDLTLKIFDKASPNTVQTINRNYTGHDALPPGSSVVRVES